MIGCTVCGAEVIELGPAGRKCRQGHLTTAPVVSTNGNHDPAEKPEKPEKPERKLPEPEPFPVEILPEVARKFVETGAASRGIPVDFIATPLFGVVAAAIGNRVVLHIKRGWDERANVWPVVVGKPGTGKSPGVDYAMQPLYDIQHELWQRYTTEKQFADMERAAGRQASTPRLQSVFTTDATLEAVASMLELSCGLAVSHDEIAGWVQSFDQYRKGGDRQKWLTMWSGGPLKQDRKTAGPVYINDPVIAVVGGVQPERLPDLRGGVINDGFPDRMLPSYPESAPIGWSDDEDDPAAVAAMTAVVTSLHGRWTGEVVETTFSDQALDGFKTFVERNAIATSRSTGLAAGWSAKAPRHVAKLALDLHCMRNPDEPGRSVSMVTLDAAITLGDYYRAHFIRCLPEMGTHGISEPAGDAGRVLRQLRKAPPANPSLSRTELRERTHLEKDRLAAALEYLALKKLADCTVVSTATKPREDWRAL